MKTQLSPKKKMSTTISCVKILLSKIIYFPDVTVQIFKSISTILEENDGGKGQ